MRRPARARAPWVALGVATAAACSVAPLSSDEGAWLAIARRVANGGVLYQDAIDNKSPFVFAFVRALDVLPGPFSLARAAFIGVIAVLLAVWCSSIASSLGAPDRPARALGIVVGAVCVLQSVFVLTVELVAVTLVVAALRSLTTDRFLLAGVLTAIAPLFDPRVIVLLAGVIVFARACGGRAAAVRTAIVALGFLAVWGAVVLSLPNLRYALVELNLSSRGSSNPWRPALQIAAAARALLPIIIGYGVIIGIPLRPGRKAIRAAGWWLMAPAAVVAAASIHPFDHYWTLILPAVPVLAAANRIDEQKRRLSNLALVGVAVLAVVPASMFSISQTTSQARLVREYEQAARVLEAALPPGGTFAQFSIQPFLGTLLPERLAMRSPLLGYLIQPSSRRESALRDLERRLTSTAAIADDGGLAVPENAVLPPYRPVWRIFHARLREYPCARTVHRITLRFRADHCPFEST